MVAPVVEEEVASVIRQLPPKRSDDMNGLSMWLIKSCAKHILYPLTTIINKSFETGIFPSILKQAKVIPIYKKDEPFLASNYRPISILPVFSKIFEKLFLIRISKFLDNHNLLSENQFGFRPGKSTTDAVMSLVDMIVENIENRRPTLGVFLDLSKAFDCVHHNILLQLVESYGIRGVPLRWLQSYLKDRSQVVQISNQLSKSEKLSYGVPQGSILSPLLFLIYVNNTKHSLQHGRLVQYADDTTLCIGANSKADLEINTFGDLNSCAQFFNDLNLKLNASKTNFINFCLRRANNSKVNVLLDETYLEEADSTKFLGIHLDRGLTWGDHINSVCKRVSSGIFALRNLSKFCPIPVRMTAYYGVIYPHLSYGIALWGGCANNDFLRIFRLQKKAVRAILNLNYRESCRESFKQLGLLTLPCLYIMETIMHCVTKTTLTQGRDVHEHNTRGRDNYRTVQHRTVASKRLPSQAGASLLNHLPNCLRLQTRPNILKDRLRQLLIREAFYSVEEYLAHQWEAQ